MAATVGRCLVAVGDLITTYNQYELNGVLLGHATDFIMSKVENLFGKSDVKTTDIDRQDAWGEYPGANRYKGRVITATVDVIGLPDPAATHSIQSNYDTLMAALAIPDEPGQMNPYEFVFYRPWTVAGKRFCYVVPGKVGVVSDFNWVLGHLQAAVQLKANDPRHYSLTLYTDNLNLLTNTRSVTEDCVNNGDSGGTPTVVITFTLASGQAATMQGQSTTYLNINNLSDSNRSVVIPLSSLASIPYPVGGNYSLVVDFRRRTITMNGVDISGYMNPSTQFWKLVPGNNTIVVDFGENFPTSALVQIQHRDTWSG